jgi:integrase
MESGGGGLDELIDTTLQESAKECAANTMKAYKVAARVIKKAFAEFRPAQVRGPHIAQFLDAHRDTPNQANQCRTVLKLAFNRAVLLGQADANPVISIPPFKTKTRERYISQSEFRAIKAQASPQLAVCMELCYLTGQRIGDVLKIKRTDMDEDGIYIKQQKTKTPLRIRWSTELRAAVESAKALSGKVRGFNLLAGGKGQPFLYDTINDHWVAACAAACVKDANLHDLRAAAGTDANAACQDSKGLLGHKSESSHQRYMRGKIVPLVEPVHRKTS